LFSPTPEITAYSELCVEYDHMAFSLLSTSISNHLGVLSFVNLVEWRIFVLFYEGDCLLSNSASVFILIKFSED